MLITGKGTSGSWQIRGVQLGTAIGAHVEPQARSMHPVTVMVKRGTYKHCIWDIVDAWNQPIGNSWNRAECMAWLQSKVNEIKPIGFVSATRQMAKDLEQFKLPTLWLPHHARPGLELNPVREKVRRVGYEGAEQYLGRWKPILERLCLARGWEFVVNPHALASVDIVVALRDAKGYAPKYWKSNVKSANAQGSGTPIICNREVGYVETCGLGECWADTEEELIQEFDRLEPQIERLWRSADLYNRRLELHFIAEKYLTWLQSNY